MTSSSRIDEICERLINEFGSYIVNLSTNIHGRIRISFADGNFLDIRYPREDAYSFHFQTLDNEFRIDCAPHHKDLKTFTNHFHKNEEILNDRWADPQSSFMDNLDG